MKLFFIKPEMELIKFTEEVIVTSGCVCDDDCDLICYGNCTKVDPV